MLPPPKMTAEELGEGKKKLKEAEFLQVNKETEFGPRELRCISKE